MAWPVRTADAAARPEPRRKSRRLAPSGCSPFLGSCFRITRFSLPKSEPPRERLEEPTAADAPSGALGGRRRLGYAESQRGTRESYPSSRSWLDASRFGPGRIIKGRRRSRPLDPGVDSRAGRPPRATNRSTLNHPSRARLDSLFPPQAASDRIRGGWSDDSASTEGSCESLTASLLALPTSGLLCVPLSDRPRKHEAGRIVFATRRPPWERNCT